MIHGLGYNPLMVGIITHPTILIIRLSSIGDVVRTLPALTSLRQNYPGAHITWVVEDKSSGILEGHPYIDDVLVFERKGVVRSLKTPLRLPEAIALLTRFLSRLRSIKYDFAFDFHGILKSGLIAFLSSSPKRVGFEKGYVKECNHLFTNLRITPSDSGLPRVVRNLELIRPFVLPENLTDRPALGVKDKHRAKAQEFIRDKLGDGHPLVAVHPGTSRTLKKWPHRSFAALCDLLTQALGAQVILTWGPGERDEVEQICSLTRTPPMIGMQTDSLLELAALLELCELMITVDSGPMHIGSAMGTPVVAIFGPTDEQINAPYWKPNSIVKSNVPCRPCDENCGYAKCMEAVKPEEVLEAASELLGNKKALTSK
jgi:3-deoxy-D-manno-octulosonic-acid transferase/heptosyltransferase-1